jgi:hypothetical protein
VAVAIGDAIGLNTITVGLLTGASRAVALLVLRLPRNAANQVPVSVLVVMAALASTGGAYGWERALSTIIGAGIGVAISLALPASRVKDARQTLERLGATLSEILEAMSAGVSAPWTPSQTSDWRRKARVARDRLVHDAKDAVGSGREAAEWNVRDRGHIAELSRYAEVLPRLERTAIGVSVISRGLDDDAHAVDGERPAMRAMSSLLAGLGRLVGAVVGDVLGQGAPADEARALEEGRLRREACAPAASRRARGALSDHAVEAHETGALQWMTYAALLVQVDRIIEDLSGPLPPPSLE